MRTRDRWLFLFCLILTACSMLCSCGKKGNPTLKSYEKPVPPAALSALHRESEILIFWSFLKDKEQEIKGFYLMKAISPPRSAGNAVFQKIAFLKNDIRHYIDKDFKTGTTYEYKIVSRNLRDVTSNDSNIVRISPEAVPSPPGNIQFKAEHDSLILSWKSAGDKIFYNIYKSNGKGKYQLMPVNKKPVKENSFRDNFDTVNPVYYTIRSVTEDDTRDEGPASEEIVVDPSEFIPSSPSDIQAVVTKQNVYLSWKEPPETWVTGYKVYREINRKEGFVLIGETQTPAYLDKDRPSTKRSYRVTALGPSKEGPPVEIRNVVFVPFR